MRRIKTGSSPILEISKSLLLIFMKKDSRNHPQCTVESSSIQTRTSPPFQLVSINLSNLLSNLLWFNFSSSQSNNSILSIQQISDLVILITDGAFDGDLCGGWGLSEEDAAVDHESLLSAGPHE